MSQPTKASDSSIPRALTNPMLGRVAAGLAIYEGGKQAYSTGRGLYEKWFSFRVEVEEGDPVYADVHRWLLSILPSERHRSLRVSTRRSISFGEDAVSPAGSSDREPKAVMNVTFNDKSPRKVDIDGHSVMVSLNSTEQSGDRKSYRTPDKIEFIARSYTAQQAVIRHIRRIHEDQRDERVPSLRMVGGWGHWRHRGDLPPRTMDSVILPADQKRRIIDDLATFLASEDRYNRLAIPWHRAYMLHGKPGTGKTSLAKAMAGHFNLDLWYLSLADLGEESSLMNLISEVGPRSILLLEDIDTMRFTHQRTGQGEGQAGEGRSLTIGALLNALDGATTPHGLITVMTTNHFDRLDDALTRAGRMDRIEEIKYPTWDGVRGIFAHFYGSEDILLPDPREVEQTLSSAEVSEIFKRHLDDPAGACAELSATYRVEVRA